MSCYLRLRVLHERGPFQTFALGAAAMNPAEQWCPVCQCMCVISNREDCHPHQSICRNMLERKLDSHPPIRHETTRYVHIKWLLPLLLWNCLADRRRQLVQGILFYSSSVKAWGLFYPRPVASMRTPLKPQSCQIWKEIIRGRQQLIVETWRARLPWVHRMCQCLCPVRNQELTSESTGKAIGFINREEGKKKHRT